MQTISEIRGYVPEVPQIKIRPEVLCAIFGFFLGMCMSMGPLETFDAGVFVLSQAAAATAWTANWIVEPKYTGQEDLPPGFRGEQPSLNTKAHDESQPMQCQTVDPSALVCSTVRVSGFAMFQKEDLQPVFHRRAFDEIQGRAPFVSENGKFLAFWCEQDSAWRLTHMADESEARQGSCKALAASMNGGVQFKDASGWVESDVPKIVFEENIASVSSGTAASNHKWYTFEISVGDDGWVDAEDITCR